MSSVQMCNAPLDGATWSKETKVFFLKGNTSTTCPFQFSGSSFLSTHQLYHVNLFSRYCIPPWMTAHHRSPTVGGQQCTRSSG